MSLLFDLDAYREEAPVQLPVPARLRWQPLRSGLLNLYRYDQEEFWFEDGRLLIRGNNGTGKSRVLALQLPFLLDGEVASHRVEPDGDPAKRMEWNLLLGKYHDRCGYTWLEFARRDEHGEPSYFTIGCGLSAVEGRPGVQRWFFVTRQRVGQQLFLQTSTGQPLTRDRLEEAIGEQGQVFISAAEYRRAIDEQLFQLGEQRYGALIDLLIQLRQPQLSRHLDEKKLSEALSEALPPLSPHILADVAESFRSLDSDRTTLEEFLAAHRGAEQFLNEYRRYTQVAARRRAVDVSRSQETFDTTLRRLRTAETERDSAARQLEEIQGRLRQFELDQQAAEATVRTLEDSPQMRAASDLDAAKSEADGRRAEAARVDADHVRATRQREASEQRLADEERLAEKCREELAARAAVASKRAAECGVEAEHRRAAHQLSVAASPEAIAAARQTLGEVLQRRHKGVRRLIELNSAVADAQHALSLEKRLQENVASQLDEALDGQRAAHQALAHEVTAVIDSYRFWHRGLRELEPVAVDELDDEFRAWVDRPDGISPLTRAVRNAAGDSAARLATARAAAEARWAAATSRLVELRTEYDRLQAGHHQPPALARTRDAESRRFRAGIPLWRACDFHDHVSPDERAGLEAALEASGMLDAWLTPNGELFTDDEHDAFLILATEKTTTTTPTSTSIDTATPAESLVDVLRPSLDRDDPRVANLSAETVFAVLRQIGLGAERGSVWLTTDGRWQLGPLRGAWKKHAAEHVGQASRDAARKHRLAEMAQEIDTATRGEELARSEVTAIDQQQRAVDAEQSAAPTDDATRRAMAAIAERQQRVAELRNKVADAESKVALRHRQLEEAAVQRGRDAADLRMDDWMEKPRDLDDALRRYQESLFEWWPALKAFGQQAERTAAARLALQEAAAEQSRQAAALHAAQLRVETAAARFATLHAAIGVEVEEIQSRLDAARHQVATHRGEQKQAQDRLVRIHSTLALSLERVTAATNDLERAAAVRDAAIGSLRRFVNTKLLTVAAPDVAAGCAAGAEADSVDDAIALAQAIEQSLTNVAADDAAWEKTQKTIHRHIEELKTTLTRYGYQPEAVFEENVFIVSVPFQGRECTTAELRDALTAEIASRQELLNAREREVLENHLIGEVATHLHDLLRQADQWLHVVNLELAERPMSTGMKLRFAWHAADDAPPGLAEARKRLLRQDGTWTTADRESLGRFLHEQIQSVRAAHEVGTWQEHLTRALDYRRWHSFDIERQQEGKWSRLTRRTHGTGSGGEKAIALTIPQFAAAAAHYHSASKHAPRLILLDEAFVGIDGDMRSKSMDLLRAFDLDFVMTSEREWGCYPTVPALAIYQLAAKPGIDAVHVSRWIWNGAECKRAPHTLPQSAAAPVAPVASNDDGNGEASEKFSLTARPKKKRKPR